MSAAVTVEKSRSIPSLDGLRGLAVLLVIVAHTELIPGVQAFSVRHHVGLLGQMVQISPGELGVSVFFVISGFLITTLLIRHEDKDGRISLKNFYLRRFFRIFPPYYAYLAVVGLLWSLKLVPMLRGAFVAAVLYGTNYYPYHLALPGLRAGWLVGHTWTLSLEEQFYLVWPACLHYLGRRRAAVLGVALMVLAPLSRAVTLHFYPGLEESFQINRMFHTRIDTMMAGAVLALLGAWPAAYRTLIRWVRTWYTGPIAVGLLYGNVYLSYRNLHFETRVGISVSAVLLAYLVAFAIQNAHTLFGRVLNAAWLRHIGVISYSIYLWQQLFDGPANVLAGHWFLDLVAIFGVAEISHYAVERPSFRVRDWVLRRRAYRGG